MVETYAQEAVRAARPRKSQRRGNTVGLRGLSTPDEGLKERVTSNPNRRARHREVAVCPGRFVKRRGGHRCG